MKQAIITKYLAPTNTKPARVKATAPNAGASLTIPWNHASTSDSNHGCAATFLAARLNWTGSSIMGSIEDGKVVHIFID
jgi:hypothetical protein